MSILSTLAGALEGAANPNPGTASGPGGAGPLAGISGALVVSQILSVIRQQPGGLAGMLQSLQQGGLGHLVQSWIGTGANLPVSPDQLRNTLGTDWILRITQATGLSQGQVEQQLSTVLPQVVDHLSPNGQLPHGDLSSELTTLAERFLHR
jgi:uncharacterized protein YidB (DUF937 family)